MSEQQNRAVLERYFQALERHDLDTIDALLHDDYVEEYPQSGERIRGKQNFRTAAENYPGGLPNMSVSSIKHNGDLGIGEVLFEYDGNRVRSCFIVELQDGRIKKSVRAYFGEPFEPPEWRAQWVERM
jgi:ketosteroid isomerase-like protein